VEIGEYHGVVGVPRRVSQRLVPGRASGCSPGGKQRGLMLTPIRPFDVATFIEGLLQEQLDASLMC
jgi:hypothetical protein